MPQKVKGKRILKNGVTAGYVRQKDGSWRFRFLKGGVATHVIYDATDQLDIEL